MRSGAIWNEQSLRCEFGVLGYKHIIPVVFRLHWFDRAKPLEVPAAPIFSRNPFISKRCTVLSAIGTDTKDLLAISRDGITLLFSIRYVHSMV
jgi:hypothetical protein